jgi:hypothetical protein
VLSSDACRGTVSDDENNQAVTNEAFALLHFIASQRLALGRLTGTDPLAMVEFLRGSPTGEDSVAWWNNNWQFGDAPKGKDRRFRLFASACCRRIWEHIPEQCNRDAVVAIEDFLEGRLPAAALEVAFVASSAVEWKEDGSRRRSEPGYKAVKYLGRGFYKMTTAASALLVASQVLFLADEEYGREAGPEINCCYYANNGVFLRPSRWPILVPATLKQHCGTGIAPDMLPRIFNLFVQAERRLDRSQGGVGIGLTLVKKLVEHGEPRSGRSDTTRRGRCGRCPGHA